MTYKSSGRWLIVFLALNVFDLLPFLFRVQKCRAIKLLTWRNKTTLQGNIISITISSTTSSNSSSHHLPQYLQMGSKPAAKVSTC